VRALLRPSLHADPQFVVAGAAEWDKRCTEIHHRNAIEV
jgi:hypothetical protein